MRRIRCFLFLLTFLVIFISCERKDPTTQAFKVHDDGRKKAITYITPIYDPSNIILPWSLSHDLTTALKTKLVKKGNVYLTNLCVEEIDIDEASSETTKNTHLDENLTLNLNYQSLKEHFPDSEFVVFLELTNHNIHPKTDQNSFFDKITPSYVLDMSMRLRIVDLRPETPSLILHEMVEQSHLIPKQFASLDIENPMWGKKTYSISPLGFAHAFFIKEIAHRIESYLILAKTQ